MTFLNPLLLWGALGAAVPLLIHLWGRRRPRRVPFPSLRLIRAGQQQQRRFSRVRDLLVLALRMALIVLVSLALARPISDSRLWAALAPGEAAAVIALDASASMAYREGPGSRFERATQAARMILERLPRGAQVRVLLAGSDLQPIGTDAAALAAAQVGFARAALLELLERCDEPLLRAPRSRLFLITDLQETSLQGELSRPLPVAPVVVDVGSEAFTNHAIVSATVCSPCPLRGRPVELEVWCRPDTAANSSPAQPRGLALSVAVNDRPAPGQTLPAGEGLRRTRLRINPQAAGDVAWRLSLPPDGLLADDRFTVVEPVREQLRVQVVSASSDPRFVTLALNPGGDQDTRVVVQTLRWGAGKVPAPGADVLVLADVAADAPELPASTRFAQGGGGLLLFAGGAARLSPEMLRELFGAPLRLGGSVAVPRDQPLQLVELATQRPPLAPFANPRLGDLQEFRFTARREVTGAENARVLARFSDGAPAIIASAEADRRCLLLNMTLDDGWTDAPYCAGYVPLLHHLCYYVAGRQTKVWPDWVTGEMMRVRLPAGASPDARVRGPDGRERTVAASGTQWEFTPELPGVYEVRWQVGGRNRTARFAANVPAQESDLRRVPLAELKRRLRAPQAVVVNDRELGALLEREPPGQADLTRLLLAVGMVLFVVETALTLPRRIAARPPRESVEAVL